MSDFPEPTKSTIGWREWVGLPDVGIKRIKAKVDSGARSSSLHAFRTEDFDRDGEHWIRFWIHPIQRHDEIVVEAEAPVMEFRSVRSSSGESEIRPVILTTVNLHGERYQVELTLTNREKMGFRMLLGREAFRGRFLLDAGRSYLGGKPKRRRRRTT
ncbi:ATP-dependent zinc protease family protein [Stratiformator vulcanicus]|nr:RimK/LysX family protein [Stratiformator vulcanicus]